MNRHVAAGVRRPPVLGADRLVAEGDAPRVRKGYVGQRHRRLGALGLRLLVLAGAHVCDDLLHGGTQHAVAAGVIRMVVAVDEHIDLTRAAFLQARQQIRCGVGELRVDHQQAVGADQPADRTAPLVEDADVAPERREYRRRRRCRRLLCGRRGDAQGAGSRG